MMYLSEFPFLTEKVFLVQVIHQCSQPCSFIHWANFYSVYPEPDSVLGTENKTKENKTDLELKKTLH